MVYKYKDPIYFKDPYVVASYYTSSWLKLEIYNIKIVFYNTRFIHN
jgi:hypothetical protein